jgi:hypothetical protein
MSRRESAVTWQLRASANPGISLRTACKPNPAMPKRTIEVWKEFSGCRV